MLRNKDILELKKRFKKESCTITKMCGCYVDANKNKVVEINETFLNLEDDEFFKYLEIAKKTLSGTIGNNLLELHFASEEEKPGGKQQYLMGLRESALKNPALLEHLYDKIIENYDYVGNYLILVFHDAYDVITKTKDDLKIDESEEVFTYLLCAICPVNLSKPGLGYRTDLNRIGIRIQDWVVAAPDVGFLFPSFIERSTDIHSLTYYVRDAKDSHRDFIESALGCSAKRTATEEQNTFHSIVKTAIAPIIENSDEMLVDIQEKLNNLAEDHETEMEDLVIIEPEEFTLTTEIIKEVFTDSAVPDAAVMQIQNHFTEEFNDKPPVVRNLVNEKAIEKKNKEKKELKLLEEVASLRQELKDTQQENKEKTEQIKTLVQMETPLDSEEAKNWSEIFLRMKPDKAKQVKYETIDGKKYLMIPIEEEEHVNLNGMQQYNS
ncbi:hypothetical protein IMSAGC011_01813 [Lachnospiraceae bacterium]|nr:hypothetical protein IMSAGC011_01813 [Lachnospiraceae bacterium]